MISKETLKQILQDEEFTSEQIERIMQKRMQTLLKKGKEEEIRKILMVLKEKEIKKDTIEKCIYIFTTGKANEISEVLNFLEEKEIKKETIENCLSVLATGKAKNIKKIWSLLEERGIKKEKIEKCMYVLARGKAEKMKQILEFLEEKKIGIEAIENCLSILNLTDVHEIKETMEFLEKKKVKKEIIENCLSVLAMRRADKVKEIWKVLENNEIDEKTISENYGWIFSNIIFDVLELENKLYVKKYMILKGKYNRIVSKEEIEKICQEKGITIDELLKELRKEVCTEQIKENLDKKGSLYLGKGMPMSQQFVKENEERITALATRIGLTFSYKYKIGDYEQLEKRAKDIIINKCGDIEYNLPNIKEIEKAIYTRVFLYLKGDWERKRENEKNNKDIEEEGYEL